MMNQRRPSSPDLDRDDDDSAPATFGAASCFRQRNTRHMFRGDSYVLDSQVLQADGCTPQDITGWTAWFTAKEHVALPDSQATIQLGTELPLTGIVFTFPTIGKMEVTVPPAATVAGPDTPQVLLYDIQVRDLLGRISTIETGTLTVRPDVTRAIV